MTAQLVLPLAPEDPLAEAFVRFDRDNPEVWRLFEQFARQVWSVGHRRYSADAILHRVRWHTSVETRSGDGFKINDHTSAFYARKWLALHPDMPLFATRARKAGER